MNNLTPPIVTGQCQQVLSLLRKHGALLSLNLTADLAINGVSVLSVHCLKPFLRVNVLMIALNVGRQGG